MSSNEDIRAAFGMAQPKPARVNPLRAKVLRDPKKAIEDHWRAKLANQGQLRSYAPTLGERVEGKLGNVLATAVGEQYGRHVAGRAIAPLNDLTPVGVATGAADAGTTFGQGITQGDIAKMALGLGAFGLSVMPMPGQVRKGAKRGLADLMRDESGAIRAYHGSPHDFDRFDMSKIGTGEGAQMYGHGLYFAENKEVAKGYQQTLARHPAEKFLDSYGGDIDAALKSAQREANTTFGRMNPDLVPVLQDMKAGNPAPGPKGRLYEVNIDAEPDDFLDWDTPFKDADEVERFAGRFDAVDPPTRRMIEDWGFQRQQSGQPMPDGNDLIRQLGGLGPQTTNRLRDAGIKGIKYLDQGSRDAAEGTRNYVVFDDRLVSIANKY